VNADPLGLFVVHTPEESPAVDIVFIHGLGGTSRATWSKDRDIQFFWPSVLLPMERDICQARILSFGYNAQVVASSGSSSASVLDFAKDLLFELKYAKDRDSEDLRIGKVWAAFTSFLLSRTLALLWRRLVLKHSNAGSSDFCCAFHGWSCGKTGEWTNKGNNTNAFLNSQ
jgi:hypothetical protein